ncbi:MAG TPA: helix-turn-helix domain-containing protein [Candidatus Sulfotelmatobacter sp.]|nr:helix-turn-helix domain-containing protein [Candidatus Sulfotelmatobacter sp.]
MGTEKVQRILKDFGLTEKEAELYIFLAKHGALRTGEIAEGFKTHRVEVYRMLKSLQAKGVVEATLELPSRFITVPFETVLDSFIEAKREETTLIESTKQSVLNDWRIISKIKPEISLEKFVVVEGNKRIYSRILNMVKETESQLSFATTIQGLARADQFGVLDAAVNHPFKDSIKFRFLTELSDENLRAIKTFFKKISKTGLDFRGRNPNLGLKLSSRMVMRDKEELLFFIRPTTETQITEEDNVCLWTNCKTLVQSFNAVFEDLWSNSRDINEKIAEIETGKPTAATRVINNASIAIKTYNDIINNAEKEILILTSSTGLIESKKRITMLSALYEKGVSIRIMAPITKDNWHAMRELSHYCFIRHIPTSYLETTIVDGKYLFQSKNQQLVGQLNRSPYSDSTFYVNDPVYVENIKSMLNDVWRNASVPSDLTLDSIIDPAMPMAAPPAESQKSFPKTDIGLSLDFKGKRTIVTEEDVLDKIINAKKYPSDNWPNDILRFYGSSGHVIIHPPKNFSLPDFMIWAMHHNKMSSFGASDCLLVYLWLETPKGHAYVPVAFVTDNPENVEFHKKVSFGTPSGKNIHLVKKDELHIRIHGNIFFAGWTIPIPLFPTSFILPPSGILLEGNGKIETGISEIRYPSGVKVVPEHNGFDAFITFFHPVSKYSGPQTDGRISRDLVVTMYPP